MTEPSTDASSQVDQPAQNMREVALWAVLFLALVAVAFYCGQLIEELTGRKWVAKAALIAIAFFGSMLVRGGFWLAKRLRGDANAACPEPSSPSE